MSAKPYPGLRAFRPDEGDIYFGREEQTDELVDRLDQIRFLSVIGPSGCGKSSLVNTGMIGFLKSGYLTSAGAGWRVARMRPQDAPLSNLAAAMIKSGIVELSDSDDPHFFESQKAFLRAILARGSLGLKEVLDLHPLKEKTSLLLVVDQFEEIFRYRRIADRYRRIAKHDEADAFVELLLQSARLEDWPVYVVLTMRSDFLGECIVFPGLPEAINAGQFLTPRLTRGQLQAAIEGPARVFGGFVEDDLIARLLNFAYAEREKDQLPILQHALMRMWSVAEKEGPNSEEGVVLTLDIYKKVGRLTNAMSFHADEAYNELADRDKDLARQMFCNLTERVSGQRDTRRPAFVGEIADVAQVEWKAIARVAEVFREPDRCFLMPAINEIRELGPDTRLDISHESLIRLWARLKGWVEKEAGAADTYRRLMDTARLWKRSEADLLRTPELEVSLKWRKDLQPTEAWARRYGEPEDFALVMELLKQSEANKKREEDDNKLALVKEEKEKNRRKIIPLLTVMVVLMGIATSFAVYYADKAQKNADKAQKYADKAKKNLFLSLANSTFLHAQQEMGNRSDLALLLTRAAIDLSADDDLEDKFRLATTLTAVPDHLVKYLGGHTGKVNAVLFSPDGEFIVSGSQDESILIRDAATGALRHRLEGHTDGVTSVVISPDGQQIVSGSWDKTIRFWDIANGTPSGLILKGHTAGVRAVAHHPHQKMLVSYQDDGELWVWDLSNQNAPPSKVLIASDAQITSLTFNHAGTQIAIATIGEDDENPDIALWDTRTWKRQSRSLSEQMMPRSRLAGGKEAGGKKVSALAFSPDDRHLASSSFLSGEDDIKREKSIRIWDVTDPTIVKEFDTLKGGQAGILDLAFSPDKARPYLATSSDDATIMVWDVSDPEKAPIHFKGHSDWVRSIAFSPDGQLLVSGSGDSRLILWNLDEQRKRFRTNFAEHQDEVWSMAFNPDGTRMASIGRDSTIRIWNLRQNKEFPPFEFKGYPSPGLAFAHDGTVLFAEMSVSDRQLQIKALNYTTNPQESRELIGAIEGWIIGSIAVDAKDQYIAYTAFKERDKGDLVIRSRARNEILDIPNLPQATGWGDGIDFSRDGRFLVYGCREQNADKKTLSDFNICLVDLETQSVSAFGTETGHSGAVFSLTFSREGDLVVSGGNDNRVIIWDFLKDGTLKVRHKIEGHRNRVNSVSMSADGQLVASGGRDHSVKIWDVAKGRFLFELKGHTDKVDMVKFAPGSQNLYTCSDDKHIFLWDLSAMFQRDQACAIADRMLTKEEWEAVTKEEWWEIIGTDFDYREVCR